MRFLGFNSLATVIPGSLARGIYRLSHRENGSFLHAQVCNIPESVGRRDEEESLLIAAPAAYPTCFLCSVRSRLGYFCIFSWSTQCSMQDWVGSLHMGFLVSSLYEENLRERSVGSTEFVVGKKDLDLLTT